MVKCADFDLSSLRFLCVTFEDLSVLMIQGQRVLGPSCKSKKPFKAMMNIYEFRKNITVGG